MWGGGKTKISWGRIFGEPTNMSDWRRPRNQYGWQDAGRILGQLAARQKYICSITLENVGEQKNY